MRSPFALLFLLLAATSLTASRYRL
jgi:hypothetical protein